MQDFLRCVRSRHIITTKGKGKGISNELKHLPAKKLKKSLMNTKNFFVGL